MRWHYNSSYQNYQWNKCHATEFAAEGQSRKWHTTKLSKVSIINISITFGSLNKLHRGRGINRWPSTLPFSSTIFWFCRMSDFSEINLTWCIKIWPPATIHLSWVKCCTSKGNTQEKLIWKPTYALTCKQLQLNLTLLCFILFCFEDTVFSIN